MSAGAAGGGSLGAKRSDSSPGWVRGFACVPLILAGPKERRPGLAQQLLPILSTRVNRHSQPSHTPERRLAGQQSPVPAAVHLRSPSALDCCSCSASSPRSPPHPAPCTPNEHPGPSWPFLLDPAPRPVRSRDRLLSPLSSMSHLSNPPSHTHRPSLRPATHAHDGDPPKRRSTASGH